MSNKYKCILCEHKHKPKQGYGLSGITFSVLTEDGFENLKLIKDYKQPLHAICATCVRALQKPTKAST